MEKFSTDQRERLSFLANTVHEIRTPVQTIIGTLDLLSETDLNSEQQEYLRQIQFSSNVLLALVNDILDFTKIKSQHLNIESIPYDVSALTERTVDFVSMEAFNKGIELIIDTDPNIPPFVMGDPTRVQQVLINIIKNAVKFTKEGYVHIGLLLQDNHTMLFKITDTGIGIPKEKRDKIFTDFYQVEAATTRKYGGTGLGLAISKGLVQSMNGKIGVNENEAGGSVFWFSLPLVSAKDFPIAKTLFDIPNEAHILVIDDNSLVRKSIISKFNCYNIKNIHEAGNAQEAVQKIERAARSNITFSIILIDMDLPKIDGLRLANHIKNTYGKNESKLFLLIPEGQAGAQAKLKTTNLFDSYLFKPVKKIRIEELLKSIYRISQEENKDESITSLEDNTRANCAKGLTTLVAEDHPLNRKLLSEMLKKYGADVIEAKNGKEALEYIRQNQHIDIIFMDIQMPEMDGILATTEIRKLNYAGVIIACTANNDENDFAKYRALGMNDILVKPFNKASIQSIIEKWHAVIELPESVNIALLDNPVQGLWNRQEFEELISNDNALGNDLLNEYCKQTKNLMILAESAIEKKDFSEIRRIAHLLKGSSASIFASALAKESGQISEAAKRSDVEGVKNVLEAFRCEFEIFEILQERWKKYRPIGENKSEGD